MGLLTKLLVPFVYLILAITGLGLMVAPLIGVALFLFAIVGKVAILEWLGAKVGRRLGSGFEKPLAAFLLGTVILTLLYLVPAIGLLTYIVFGIWGLGSGVTAVFRPWPGRKPRKLPLPRRHPRRLPPPHHHCSARSRVCPASHQ